MTEQLRLEEVTAILLQEHQSRYDDSLPPKALHKILYFVDQEIEREHVDADLPLFWYMYGAVVKTTNTGIDIVQTNAGRRVTCELDVSGVDASEKAVRRGREAITRGLERYYNLGLEDLTDEMYEEAPYEVQRLYRRLDQQFEVETHEEQTTLFQGQTEHIRETLHDFVENFPLDDFPEYEDDLCIWYRLLSAELDSRDYDSNRAQRLSKKFWRLFCLELACRENNGLSREEIAEDRNIESVDHEKQELRSEFLELEREKARRNARDSEDALKAAEAAVIPHLNFEVMS